MTSANHAETTFSDFPNLDTKDRSETVVRRCSLKFHKFQRKAHVLESLFNKLAGLKT